MQEIEETNEIARIEMQESKMKRGGRLGRDEAAHEPRLGRERQTCSDRAREGDERGRGRATSEGEGEYERVCWRHERGDCGGRAVTLAVEMGFVPCTTGSPADRLGPAEMPSPVQARLHNLNTPRLAVSNNAGRTTPFALPDPSLGPYAGHQTGLGCIAGACLRGRPPIQSRPM